MFVCISLRHSALMKKISTYLSQRNIRFNFSDSGVYNTVSTKAATDKENIKPHLKRGDKIGLYVFANEKPLHRLKVTTMYALPTKMENGY